MNSIDYGLKLIKGTPIDIGIGMVHPLKLSEIHDIGETQYNQYLGFINVDAKTLQIEDETIKPFQIVQMLCTLDQAYRINLLSAMQLMFKEEIKLHQSGVFFIGNEAELRILNEEKFEIFRDVIRKQNFLSEQKEEKFNPKDDKAKELIEKYKNIQKQLKERNKEKGLGLEDIISIVTSYVPNVDLFNVWDLTVYQLYTIYSRLMMKENYESNFAVYLQSGDPNSLDLKHWARRINNTD